MIEYSYCLFLLGCFFLFSSSLSLTHQQQALLMVQDEQVARTSLGPNITWTRNLTTKNRLVAGQYVVQLVNGQVAMMIANTSRVLWSDITNGQGGVPCSPTASNDYCTLDHLALSVDSKCWMKLYANKTINRTVLPSSYCPWTVSQDCGLDTQDPLMLSLLPDGILGLINTESSFTIWATNQANIGVDITPLTLTAGLATAFLQDNIGDLVVEMDGVAVFHAGAVCEASSTSVINFMALTHEKKNKNENEKETNQKTMKLLKQENHQKEKVNQIKKKEKVKVMKQQNLLLEKSGQPLYPTSCPINVSNTIKIEKDNNLVIRDAASGEQRWATNTSGMDLPNPARLVLDPSGLLVLRTDNYILWDSQHGTYVDPQLIVPPQPPPKRRNTLYVNERLYVGEQLISSSGLYSATMTADDGLVIADGNQNRIWSTHTQGGKYFTLRKDFDLVIYGHRQGGHSASGGGGRGARLVEIAGAGGEKKRDAGERGSGGEGGGQGGQGGHGGGHGGEKGGGRQHQGGGDGGGGSGGGGRGHGEGGGESSLHTHNLEALWCSGTRGHGTAQAVLEDHGTLVLYINNQPAWNTPPPTRRGL